MKNVKNAITEPKPHFANPKVLFFNDTHRFSLLNSLNQLWRQGRLGSVIKLGLWFKSYVNQFGFAATLNIYILSVYVSMT